MGQSISAWDAVLKEYYEGSVVSQIENKTRLLKSFGEQDAPTVDGRRVVFPLHIGRNSGVMSSVEGATLPTAGQQRFVDIHIPLRKTVGRITITKDVIDASKSNRGSFKRAMATEMDGLVRDIAEGVASPTAHGQEITSTVTDNSSEKPNTPISPSL